MHGTVGCTDWVLTSHLSMLCLQIGNFAVIQQVLMMLTCIGQHLGQVLLQQEATCHRLTYYITLRDLPRLHYPLTITWQLIHCHRHLLLVHRLHLLHITPIRSRTTGDPHLHLLPSRLRRVANSQQRRPRINVTSSTPKHSL